MNTAMKLGSYALGLAVLFGGALGVGKVVAPEARTSAAEARTSPHAAPPEQQHQQHQTADTAADTPGGLQVSQDGYTLNPITSITTGVPTDFRFTVIGPDGRPVTDYKVEHDKKLHFIVVSRDLTSFQHLHPELAPDGTWSVKLTLPKAGPYRAFADFAPVGGQKLTLGADLQAAGDYRPEPLPHVSRTAIIDDYTVNLAGDLVAGRSSKLTLTVSKNGEPVTDLEPYLGAYGHLVALRAGDLAYLHVHPEESEQAGPEITFYAEAPSRGDFRLFLDFKHEGKVRTASFTATATLADGHAPSATHNHSH
ncbi:hypothetical protein ACU635_04045 [[Actinomadura] parvosata]|uniref:hypothetical protein n=1 Tax=[Actinomadura] parvosata TaxID=1955412 RepID=UPI00406D1877